MNKRSLIVRNLALLCAAALAAPARSQQALDETWTVTVNGRSVTANPDGSFFIGNIPVIDRFGADGPGSPPDSLSDTFLRVTATSTAGPFMRQAFSEPFQIRRGETFQVGELTLDLTLLRSISITPKRSLVLIGESTQLTVTGSRQDGLLVDVTPRSQLTVYGTSNPRVATVGRDGLVTARGRGTAFITAENSGITAVARIDAASDTLRLRISGLIRLPDGTAAAGASLHIPSLGLDVMAAADGSFDIEVEALLDTAFSLLITFEAGDRRFSRTVELEAADGLELIDLGSIQLAAEPPADLFLPRVFDSGGPSIAMASADLDGDGDPDLATVNQNNTLGVLRNQGDATFASLERYRPGGALGGSIALGDLDGDGDADGVVTAGSGFLVLRNLSDGTLADHGQYAFGAGTVAIGDVDKDGDSDLTVGFGDLFVFRNQGDGTFAAPAQYASGNDAFFVVLGDVDLDGDSDLVAGARDTGTPGDIAVLRNQGDGTFAARVLYPVGFGVRVTSIALSDLDGNDVLDIAAANLGTPAAAVLLNRGDGTFAPVARYAVEGIEARSVAAGDLDGDGIADLSIADAFTANVSVLLNRGDGTLAPHVPYTAGFRPRAVILDDFDGDGDRDAAVANSANVQVLRNQGDGTLASHYIQYDAGGNSTSVAFGDVDGDGDADLALGIPGGFPGIAVLRNAGDGAFGAPVKHEAGRSPQSVVWADLDGDGDMDLAAADFSSERNSVSILRNQGGGGFAAFVPYEAGRQPIHVVAGDVDSDGDADLVAANPLTNSVSVLRNQGDATFAAFVPYLVGGAIGGGQPHSIALGDLDGDGHRDLAVAGSSSVGPVGILRNQGDGTFTPHASLDVGGDALGVALGDLDGDGDADLAVPSCSCSGLFANGVALVLRNQGGGRFAAPVEHSTAGSDPRAIVLGDIDLDGAADIVAAHRTSAAISVLRNLGVGTFAAPVMYGVVADAYSVALGDLDGNGDPDLAVGHNLAAKVSVLLNQTAR